MKHRKEVSIVKQFIFSPIGIVLSIIVLFVVTKANYSLYVRNDAARENRETLHRELSALEYIRDRLAATLGRIGTQKGEEIALRQQYDVGNDGEELLIVIDNEAVIETGTETTSIWKKIKSFIPFF